MAILNPENPGKHHPSNMQILTKAHNSKKNKSNWKRFDIDEHDNRTAEDFYELVGDDDGVFGCMSLMACEDHCPKHLPLQNKIAYLRRKLVALR